MPLHINSHLNSLKTNVRTQVHVKLERQHYKKVRFCSSGLYFAIEHCTIIQIAKKSARKSWNIKQKNNCFFTLCVQFVCTSLMAAQGWKHFYILVFISFEKHQQSYLQFLVQKVLMYNFHKQRNVHTNRIFTFKFTFNGGVY